MSHFTKITDTRDFWVKLNQEGAYVQARNNIDLRGRLGLYRFSWEWL